MRHFIFVEAKSVEQEACAYVRRLGFSPVLFTCFKATNPEFYRNINFSGFDQVFDVDTHDVAVMLSLIRSKNLQVAGINGSYDDIVLSAAKLAAELSLPHPDITGLQNAYYKDQVRNLLGMAGVKQPSYKVIDINSLPTTPPLPFPFVIKPIRDAGAFGVHFCQSELDYLIALKRYQSDRHTLTGIERTKLLFEEYLPGNFYGAEFLWQQNKWQMIGINQIFVDASKSLCMTGITHPADIPPKIHANTEKELLNWLNILGLKGGAVNIEFKLIDNMPMLIEVNLRLAGAYVSRQIQLTTDVNLIEYVISQACGIEKKWWPINPQPNKYVADAFIFAKQDGVIGSIDTTHVDKQNVIEINTRQLPVTISHSGQDFATVIGHVLASGSNCQEAMQNGVAAVNQINLVQSIVEETATNELSQERLSQMKPS